MKTSKITLGLVAIVVAASLTVTSCRKKEKTTAQEPDNEQATASDNALAENSSNDIISMGSQLSENNNNSMTSYRLDGSNAVFTSTCAVITGSIVGTGSVVNTYTVDFGTQGCLCNDNRTRKGKLMFDFTGSTNGAKFYRNPGFKMVVTSAGYVVDGNQVNIINKMVTNTTPLTIAPGANPGTNLTWSIAANISIIKANSETVTWTCNRTKELINTSDANCYGGQSMPINWTKAKVQLNGNASGVNAKGENYTAVATNLVRDFTCAPDPLHPHRHPFISGTVVYTPGTRPTRTIDYGNGSCDFNATVTVNGQTFSITLP